VQETPLSRTAIGGASLPSSGMAKRMQRAGHVPTTAAHCGSSILSHSDK